MEDRTPRPRPTWSASTIIDGWAAPQPPVDPVVIDCTPGDPAARAELSETIRQHRNP